MTQTARKLLSTKKATILGRKDLGNGRAEYTVQSSNGKDEYTIECVNHVIQDCPCKHHQISKVVCYHMRSCQIRELEIETEEKILNEAIKIVADTEKKLDEKLYEELGKTKKTAAQREAEARKKAERKRANAPLNGDGGFRMMK